LPAGTGDRSPHQPHALSPAVHPGRRSGRDHRGAEGGARRRATRGTRERPGMTATTMLDVQREMRALVIDRLDMQLLLAHVLARPRSWVIAHDDAVLDADALERLRALAQR